MACLCSVLVMNWFVCCKRDCDRERQPHCFQGLSSCGWRGCISMGCQTLPLTKNGALDSRQWTALRRHRQFRVLGGCGVRPAAVTCMHLPAPDEGSRVGTCSHEHGIALGCQGKRHAVLLILLIHVPHQNKGSTKACSAATM